MTRKIEDLRSDLRKANLLKGYAAALAPREIAESVLAGTMTPAEALQEIGKRYPTHEGLARQLGTAPTAPKVTQRPKARKVVRRTQPAPMAGAQAAVVATTAAEDTKLSALRVLAAAAGVDLSKLAKVDELEAQVKTLQEKLEAAQAAKADAEAQAKVAQAEAEAAKKAKAEQPAPAPKAEQPEVPAASLEWTDNLKMERADGRCPWGVDPNFTPSPTILAAQRYVNAGRPVFLVGPAGSGKTQGLRWIAKQANRKLIVVSMHGHVMADTLEGSAWLDAIHGNTVMRWSPGVLELAMREGALLVFDEFDRAPVAVQHLCNGVAETGMLTFREGPHAGKTLYAAPGFMVLGTGNTIAGSNGQYQSNGVESSTLSRFRVLLVDYDTEAEARLLKAAGITEEQAKILQSAVAEARAEFGKKHLPRPTGTRHLKKLAEDVTELGFSLLEAWEYNVANLQNEGPTHPARVLAMEIGAKWFKQVQSVA